MRRQERGTSPRATLAGTLGKFEDCAPLRRHSRASGNPCSLSPAFPWRRGTSPRATRRSSFPIRHSRARGNPSLSDSGRQHNGWACPRAVVSKRALSIRCTDCLLCNSPKDALFRKRLRFLAAVEMTAGRGLCSERGKLNSALSRPRRGGAFTHTHTHTLSLSPPVRSLPCAQQALHRPTEHLLLLIVGDRRQEDAADLVRGAHPGKVVAIQNAAGAYVLHQLREYTE